uniref:protein-tyrosine-phosphatase n=1 Tax=Anopheles coluzzii TaxID=1518534 RepID=A0A6E8WA67_ANOCL|nr:phosphatidylinositol phosphatase PTPRQ [Anopheles coluzzii]XP_040231430.2 phosphatidylinositol phosphatase PTPRQ [Anopheles coluzzii]XP_040231431.2 phosphatidylinositol phosphatase PTPRQ [Anopheles coluzzii]XP_049466651.1 phosphatidylinositol phosphatase PTPRQ [Anopheles coluzzii]
MVVKGIVLLLVVLLGRVWTLIHTGRDVYNDENSMEISALPSQTFDDLDELDQRIGHCHLKPLNITVSRSVVNVEEWSDEKDDNVFYRLEVQWIQPNATVSNANLTAWLMQNIALPVRDQCSLLKLKACQRDLRTPVCVCGEWEPQCGKITDIEVMEVGNDNPSYALTWKVEDQACVHRYELLVGSSVIPLDIPFVGMSGLQAGKKYRVVLKIICINASKVQHLLEIYVKSPVKRTTLNPWRCGLEFYVQHRNEIGEVINDNPKTFQIYHIARPFTTRKVCSKYGRKESYKTKTHGKQSVSDTNFQPTRVPVDVSTPQFPLDAFPKPSHIELPSNAIPKVLSSIPPLCPGLRTRSSSGDVIIKPQTVGPVRDLRANTDLDRSVLLTWRPPKEGAACVKEYLITWSSESATIDASRTVYNVTNLEPCMTYEFTVNAIDHTNDKGTPESISATVRELQQLSQVTELELNEVEPRSLSVKWKPPTNGTFCVESYRVVAWYNNPANSADVTEVFSNTTTDQHVTFGEVIACMSYTVQVIPISISKHDGLNEIGTIKTKERTILFYHVEPIRAIALSSRSLELSTMLHSENNNNCLLVTVAFNCTKMVEGVPVPESQVIKEFVIPNGNTTFEGIVEPLVPYSTYECNAKIQNIAGWSDPTPAYTFVTAEDVPESPSVIELIGKNRSIGIIWKAPTVKNGVVVRYRIHVRMVAPEYPLPKLCAPLEEFNETVDLRDEVNPDESRSWDGIEFEHVVAKLNPYTLYMVQVAAATGAGFGPYTEPVEVITLPDVSNVTASFRIDKIEGPELNQPYKSSVWFGWDLPCGLNGRLKRFVGEMYGIREQDPSNPHALTWEVNVGEEEEILDVYSYVEDRLKPEYNYTVAIRVEVAAVEELSDEVKVQFESPAGIPSIDQKEEWFNVDVFEAPNPTNTARIMLGNITLTSDIGSIRYMALLVSERLCQPDPTPRTDFINSTGGTQWPSVSDWYLANEKRCAEQYQTTPKFWNPMARGQRATTDREAAGLIEYVIGKENCDRGQEYCNGPLKPGTEYALIVRIFSRSGYTDSEMQVFRTDSLIKVGLIVSAVLACLVLAFLGGLFVVWRKQRLLLPAQQTRGAPTEEPADIPVKNFPHQYDELFQSNREKVSKEFQAINYFSDFALQDTVSFQSARENERKNRYVNILPYDSNRVLLDSNEDGEEGEYGANDYINASFIEGYKYQREYIATQGPKQETCADFWRMVLQYEIESIVMLTQPIDHDKNKCCQYFPRFDQYTDYGDIRVKCTQELNLSLYYKRLFLVSKGNLTKAVFHYHFLEWPDHSCPASTADLIKFSKIVRAERKSYAIPLVVHCSAGVGRTGTFIALDIVLQRLQQEKKINVYDTVKQLRRQRVKMVQTLDQYTFLYQCCMEYVSKSNRKKPKTSNIEIIRRDEKGKQHYPDVILEVEQQHIAVGNGGKPLFNIKFPKSVNAGGLANVSFAPNEIESDKSV